MSIQELLLLPDGQTLAGLLDPNQYEILQSWVEDSLGGNMALYDRQKPFALLQLAIQQLVPANPASYELFFLQEAAELDKEIFGLETVQDQLAAFDSIPFAEQVAWSLETMSKADSLISVYDQMVSAYKQEDLERLYAMIVEESPELRDHADELLDRRNARWIPVIQKLTAEKSTFIAVGAGHLGGRQGLIHMLRAAGYTLNPVLPKTEFQK